MEEAKTVAVAKAKILYVHVVREEISNIAMNNCLSCRAPSIYSKLASSGRSPPKMLIVPHSNGGCVHGVSRGMWRSSGKRLKVHNRWTVLDLRGSRPLKWSN
ncbi:unnamed protein product [Nesidiocoris tenuis]|uniref:Uncharacterized protein n=1 Tax=Nesidiocoris tenuis TaxID=355587 RepID=A0A6H5GP36_9HEMI|nr:unnamed protein product [Nesidiocoris tenuis]